MPRRAASTSSVADPVQRISRVCGVSPSNAPIVTTISQPVLRATPMTSSQNVCQRRLGSTPDIKTRSRPPGNEPAANDSDGHTTFRITPSMSSTVGRDAWKSMYSSASSAANGRASLVRVSQRTASVWAPVPHYVATPPNPKATRAILDRLRELLDLNLDLTELDIASSAWERSVSEVVSGDPDVASYVERLEARFDTGDAAPGWVESDEEIASVDAADDADDWFDEDDIPSGETLAEDFERYLRDQPED